MNIVASCAALATALSVSVVPGTPTEPQPSIPGGGGGTCLTVQTWSDAYLTSFWRATNNCAQGYRLKVAVDFAPDYCVWVGAGQVVTKTSTKPMNLHDGGLC